MTGRGPLDPAPFLSVVKVCYRRCIHSDTRARRETVNRFDSLQDFATNARHGDTHTTIREHIKRVETYTATTDDAIGDTRRAVILTVTVEFGGGVGVVESHAATRIATRTASAARALTRLSLPSRVPMGPLSC